MWGLVAGARYQDLRGPVEAELGAVGEAADGAGAGAADGRDEQIQQEMAGEGALDGVRVSLKIGGRGESGV